MRHRERRLLVVAFALLAWELRCIPASAQTDSARNVLTIYGGAVDYPTNPVLDAAIRAALSSPPGRSSDYFAEYLEFDRFPEVETSLAFRDYIARKYASRRIDVVIASATRAVQFVLKYRRELFPEAAIVVAGIGAVPDAYDRTAGRGLTGVRIGNAFAQTLKLALELHPTVEEVFVVAISPNQPAVDTVRAELHPFSGRVRMRYIEAETVPRLLAAVAGVPQGSLILYIWYLDEGPGYVMDPRAPAQLVADAATVPVYGVVDALLGTGIVGGVVRRTRDTGARAGQMARQILDGTPAGDIPIEEAPLGPVFDWRQLQRWRIDRNRLPPGSEIRFRTVTAWESYRWYIIGTAIVVGAQLLLIAGLLAQRAQRQRAEETVRTREASLRISFERIRQLAGRLINVEETTRSDIARDLHDDLCQELVGVCMTVTALRGLCGPIEDDEVQKELSKLQHRTLDMVQGVRQMSHELHPSGLRLVGLAGALKAHCVEVEKRYDVQVSFMATGDFQSVHPDLALCLFRIAQEALRNGAVHGEAHRLVVSLAKTRDNIELTVHDDGSGFDLEAVRREGRGLGLISMEERAHLVGGHVEIVSGGEFGTTIHVRVAGAGDLSVESDYDELRVPEYAEHAVHATERS